MESDVTIRLAALVGTAAVLPPILWTARARTRGRAVPGWLSAWSRVAWGVMGIGGLWLVVVGMLAARTGGGGY